MSEQEHTGKLHVLPDPDREPITTAWLKQRWPIVAAVALATLAWADVKFRLSAVETQATALGALRQDVSSLKVGIAFLVCKEDPTAAACQQAKTAAIGP